MAFVLVQHLDPKHISILPELLAKATKMPVSEIKDGMPVEPNHIYVIPSNVNMAIFHRVLNLMPRTEIRGMHMPIDYFLRSLAEDQGSKAIGVILSGTASDGALGLKEIKAAGGITFAQDPGSAEYDGMPRSAIAAGVVDFILPPENIANELARIGRHPYITRPKAAEEAKLLPEAKGDLVSKIFLLLRSATGVDFTYYKQTTITRRITRRMVVNKLDKLEDYVRYLQDNPAEVEALYQDILITVTEFFRDQETFEALKSEVFPEIIKDKAPGASIRVWVPGCSTGEEPYSIAISLLEFLEEMPKRPPILIFATDINEKAIEKARLGIYPESITADVSPERQQRFFVKVEGGYQINKVIREMCIFAKHDVTKDPPFSRLDLISFRNVLIYLDSVLQKKVIPALHYALQPKGYLVLGTSETVDGFMDLFELVDKKHKIYSKKPVPSRLPVDFAARGYPLERLEVGKGVGTPAEAIPTKFDVEKEANHIVLGEYAPAGVIINDNMEILQFRGHTGPYIEPAPGRASLNLLNLVREELALDVRTAINEARKTNVPVSKEDIRIRYNGDFRNVDIEVVPIKAPSGESYYLVLFKEISAPSGPEVREAKPSKKKKPAKEQRAEESEINKLKQDIAATKEYLKSTIEEKDAALEELRAANEEIQSSNEELQSINEELETSKEELQSTNEELTTVNDELQNRNLELMQLNDDLNNLIASIDIPIIILGNDLRIRRFSPMAERILNIIPSDIGRPIGDIRLKIDIPDLEQLILDVVRNLSMKQEEVQDKEARWYSVQIRPYRTSDNKIDGAVIALLDIHQIKCREEEIKTAKELSNALNHINEAITSTLDFDKIIQRVVMKSAKAMKSETTAIALREAEHWLVKYVDGLLKETQGTRFTDEQAPHMALAANTKKPVVVDNAHKDEKIGREFAEAYKLRSFMVVPLIVREEIIGVLSFYYHSSQATFTEAQIDFANKLATSISLALENVRLYAIERNIADTLQSALIRIPEHIEGVEYGYLYRSATEATKVGGDFFDIFELEHDRVGIMVGDVSGKGLEAASITSLVRNTVRAYAYEEESPAAILSKTNDAVKKSTPASYFITLFLGIIGMKTGTITYCSAGHPPALLKRKTSVIELFDVSSPVIGAFSGLSYKDDTATMKEGDILVLYTDGITEARCDGGFFGEERLVTFLESLRATSAKDVPQDIFNEVINCTGGELSDDVVLLSLSLSLEALRRGYLDADTKAFISYRDRKSDTKWRVASRGNTKSSFKNHRLILKI